MILRRLLMYIYKTNTKEEAIPKIYNDLSGFGSIQQTFEEARKMDNTISLNDVKAWKANTSQKNRPQRL